jgi:hypothetical protein
MGFRVIGSGESVSEKEEEGVVSPVIARNGESVYDWLCRFVAWIEDVVQSILDKPFTWIVRLDQSGSLTSVLQKIRKIVLRVVEWDEDIWSIIKWEDLWLEDFRDIWGSIWLQKQAHETREASTENPHLSFFRSSRDLIDFYTTRLSERLSSWIYQSQVNRINEQTTILSDPSEWIDIWQIVSAWRNFWSDYAKSRWFDRTSPQNSLTTRKADIFRIIKGLSDHRITFTEVDQVKNLWALSIFTSAPSDDAIVEVQYTVEDNGNITFSVHRRSEGEGNISWVYTHLPHIIIPSSMDLAEVRWFLEKQLFPPKEDEEELGFEPRDLQWIREKRVRATCDALRSILGEWVSIDRVEKFWPRWTFRVESSKNRILRVQYKVDTDGSITLAVYRESEIEGVDTFLEYINVPVSMHTSRVQGFLEDSLFPKIEEITTDKVPDESYGIGLSLISWEDARIWTQDVSWWEALEIVSGRRKLLSVLGARWKVWALSWERNWDHTFDPILNWNHDEGYSSSLPVQIRDSDETPIDTGENGFDWLTDTWNGHLNWHTKLEELPPGNGLEQDDWTRETNHFARFIKWPFQTIGEDTPWDGYVVSSKKWEVWKERKYFRTWKYDVVMDFVGDSMVIGSGHVVRPSHDVLGRFTIEQGRTPDRRIVDPLNNPEWFEWVFEISGNPLELLRETVEIFYPHQSCQFIDRASPGVRTLNYPRWESYLYTNWTRGVVCFSTTGITSNDPGVTLIDADRFMEWKEWFVDVIRWLEQIFWASHRTRLNGSVNRNWNWDVSFRGGRLADRAEWAEVRYWDN